MNTMNENAQAMTLTEAVTTMAVQLKELVDLAKAESTTATTATTGTTATAEATITEAPTATTETTTATEATSTTAAETTATTEAPIIVLDDDDSVIGVGGSMIEQNPMDLIPTAEAKADTAAEAKADTAAEAKADDTAEAEETVPADDEAAEEYLDNIIVDISALYNITEYALRHEGKNIESDRSPYAPKENKMGVIGDYRVFISKEFTKCDHVEGSFRIIIKDKVIVNPIMDLEFRIIDNHYKMISSKNVHRMEKMKEDHDLMRFLEIVEEVSNLVMSKYISK